MKKLLAIVMVLGLATFASAALKLELVGSNLQINAAGGEADQYFALQGAVSGGAMAGNLSADFTFFGPDADKLGVLGGAQGISGMLATAATNTTGFAAGPVVTGIHYEGGEAILYGFDSQLNMFELDRIPEPITMTLLGLGGLVALRRRMA